ncbi:hypothetical protein HWV62_19571 [Athelia sp. TMB]|nr:hypothetical protein HWV62_19571 [Athelia sp. TMB]
MAEAVTQTDFPALTLLNRGKVRDVYATSSPQHLLFVATDRISAYDVIMRNGIPGKGKLLTQISIYWFSKLSDIIPNHFVTANIDEMPEEVRQYKDQLEGRAMLVKKAEVIPLEAIVRGYLTGSAWKEYKQSGTVHTDKQEPGLVEFQKFPEPILTPSTKAEQGAHDENISAYDAKTIVGHVVYQQIEAASLKLFKRASEIAEAANLILVDTKFEFGLIPGSPPTSLPEIILVDEVLTPDSSRYWDRADYERYLSTKEGEPQSFDKQYLRNWLTNAGFKKGLESGPEGKEGEGWTISQEAVEKTQEKYEDAVNRLIKGSA